MKIAISHPKLKPKSTDRKFTKNELKFIQFMEEDDDLEDFIKSAREKADIPPGGFDLNIPLAKYLESGEFKKMDLKIVYDQADFIHGYLYGHIPKYWITTLIMLIVFNIALPPEKIEIEPIEIEASRFEVRILVKRKVPVKEIMSFIVKNKNIIDQLPENPSVPKIKVQDIKLFKKISQLKKDGLSDLKISQKLDEDSSSEPPLELDHAAIGVYRNRFRKYKYKILDYERRHRIVQAALKQAMERYQIEPSQK